ncbi:MAG: hypothetical protein P4L64_10625 [Caulobacteraceae bacterium]|nr:hypothetical protein [Caulobacteraceae bacterium]
MADLSVFELANRLGAEASRAAEFCDDCQEMSAGFFTGKEPTPDLIARAQDLDRLTQQLRAIATALHSLAGQACPDWRVAGAKITEGIGLADLADRLDGGERTSPDHLRAPAGDMEMF